MFTKEQIAALRDEAKAKKQAAREALEAARMAEKAYRNEKIEVVGANLLARMAREEKREQSAQDRLRMFQAKREQMRANAEKLKRLETQKAEMNASRKGATHAIYGSANGRNFAANQIAATHGVSDAAPRWSPRPEIKYLP